MMPMEMEFVMNSRLLDVWRKTLVTTTHKRLTTLEDAITVVMDVQTLIHATTMRSQH